MSLLPIVAGVRRPEAVGLPTRRIHDQRDVNCCFSCALASAMEAGDPAMPELAPLFHFHFAGGQSAIVAGLTIDQAHVALLHKGMCASDHHRFPISRPNVSRRPSDDAVEDGFTRRPIDLDAGTLFWKSVSTAAPEGIWKRYLAAGFPIVIGLQPNHDYLTLDAARPVLRSNRPPYSTVSHAAVVIGYSDAESSFVVQDSRYGTAFGLEGQWFLPYDLCSSPFIVIALALCSDDFD